MLYYIKKLIPVPVLKIILPYYHRVMGFLAALYYGFPSRKLIVIGVTGTTGKTTTTYILAQMLQNLGYKVGYTSTAMFGDGEKEWLNDKKMTMIGRFFTQKMLRNMLRNNCEYAIVETTSEGIVQFRHKYINYDTLIFTGLYPEHIESHGSFENYKRAKGLLFAHMETCKKKYIDKHKKIVSKNSDGARELEKTTIINGDDNYSEYFLRFGADKKYSICKEKCKTYNFQEIKLASKIKEIYYDSVEASVNGISYNVFDEYKNLSQEVGMGLLAKFNALNSMFGFVLGLSQNFNPVKVAKALSEVNSVPGRLEQIKEGQEYRVIVDYAFEPVALEAMYKTIMRPRTGKIIHVLGSAGGGRDKARRPELGRIAGENAHIVIVTNEDSYDEDPVTIINDVARGAFKAGKRKNKDLFTIMDRRDAIQFAISQAGKGDLILITGKGCEQGICLAQGKIIPWDDREVVRESIKS